MNKQDLVSHINESYVIDYEKEKIGIAALFLLVDTENVTAENKKIAIAAQKDYDDFKELLVKMRFEVKESKRTGLSEQELKDKLKYHPYTEEGDTTPYSGAEDDAKADFKAIQIARIKHDILTEHSCFIALFIGHGGNGYIMSEGKQIDIHKDILPNFFPKHCLNGKPKVFIVQACRGEQNNLAAGIPSNGVVKEIPAAGSDMLLCYSAWNDFVSYIGVDPSQGTPYLQTFIKLLKKYGDGHHSFIDILTEVSQQVSQGGIQLRDEDKIEYQMPCFESSLRKKLFLKVDPPILTHQPVTSDV